MVVKKIDAALKSLEIIGESILNISLSIKWKLRPWYIHFYVCIEQLNKLFLNPTLAIKFNP